VTIKSVYGANLPLVPADRIQLQQALLNLAVNGMDAMADTDVARRQLVVTTGRIESDAVQISVTDAGPGFREEELPRLFDSFFTTKPHGIGLGLSISRSIVEAHAGVLRAENRAGGGAVFRMVLPVVDSSAPPSRVAQDGHP